MRHVSTPLPAEAPPRQPLGRLSDGFGAYADGRLRLAAYTDYVYKQRDGRIYAQRAFALFLARLGGEVESLAIAGRLDPDPGESYYPLPDDVEFVPLPHYASLAKPLTALPAMAGSV